MLYRYAIQFTTGRIYRGRCESTVNDGNAMVFYGPDGEHTVILRNVESIEISRIED